MKTVLAAVLALPAMLALSSPAAAAEGERLFNLQCKSCHGAKSTPMGPALGGVFGLGGRARLAALGLERDRVGHLQAAFMRAKSITCSATVASCQASFSSRQAPWSSNRGTAPFSAAP